MEVFLAETGEGMEEETNKNVILGKVLNSTQCCQEALEYTLHLNVPSLGKGEARQTPASVIGSGLLGQGRGGWKLEALLGLCWDGKGAQGQ